MLDVIGCTINLLVEVGTVGGSEVSKVNGASVVCCEDSIFIGISLVFMVNVDDCVFTVVCKVIGGDCAVKVVTC